MPFGMGMEESVVAIVALAISIVPLVGAVWGLIVLARLRNDQLEILTHIRAIERKLNA